MIKQTFNIALETKRFDIELYWKRTAYFILFIGAVFIGYYQIIREFGLRKSL
ncbi:RipA family octameric membrane protein [Prevotella koreensis]